MTPQDPARAIRPRGAGDATADRAEGIDMPALIDESATGYSAVVSFGQERLWMLDQLLPDKSVYNEMRVDRLVGRLDVRALERALNEIVVRHDVLRTSFAMIDGELHQVVAAAAPLALQIEDLAGFPPSEREVRARRCAEAEVAVPFDLRRGPLIRARLLRLREEEHWLLLTKHHIVSDRWSAAVLARELSALYFAFSRGEASPLRELPVQYADYAAWQREWLQGEALEARLAYWTTALADLATLDLPTDRPRPLVASYRGGQVELEIDERLTRELKDLSRRGNATLFMTLLASFQVLLHRMTGQEDIAVGAPVAGRSRVEFEELIGFFVNTIVLRGDLSGEPSFLEYLTRVRARAVEAYAHQDLPFEKLVTPLAPSRDLSRNPLYQVALRLGNTPSIDLALPGLVVQRVEGVSRETAKFDLSIGVNETRGRLAVRAEYAADLFDATTIERMMAHWRVLLEGIVADPGQSIGRLPLLTAEERRQLLAAWNTNAAHRSSGQCIQQLFEAQVERTPDAVAVAFGTQQLTYAELNARANRLAHRLRKLGVGPEVLVAVCLDRSIELVVGLLGILKSGGAYVPLDPGYPAQRLAFMLADTRAPVLLTQEPLLGGLSGHAAQALCFDRDEPEIACEPATNPAAAASATNLAYVIYTSGSTGEPKGVMIEHRSLLNHIASMLQRFAPDGDNCVLLSSPVGFDQSIWQILFPLASGGSVAVLEAESHRSAGAMVDAVRHHGVTVLRIVPTMLTALLRGPGLAQCPSLRLVISAGETLERGIAGDFVAQCNASLVNAYGPTEATFVSTLWTCDGETNGRRVPIGTPIGNVRTYVLDRNDQPVPVGVRGELCIGGDGVGRGYWRRPELTARAFVADPLSTEPSARMYRTGDIGCHRPDGNLEFHGRRDQQIKCRGARIEMGEIEAVFAKHAGVADVVVIAREDTADDRRLVAYFTARIEPSPTAHDLREFLVASLPAYMIPAAFVRLQRFPLTPNGKVDRERLPAPDAQSIAVDRRFVAPRNAVEAQLAAIFAQTLNLESVGVHDDFFALGGHSLLVMRLLSRVTATFGAGVEAREFFGGATIAKLAGRLEQVRENSRASDAEPGQQVSTGPQILNRPRVPASASSARRGK